MSRNWVERDHPRHPAGSDKGGEFRDKLDPQAVLETARRVQRRLSRGGTNDTRLNSLAYALDSSQDEDDPAVAEHYAQRVAQHLLDGPIPLSGGGYIDSLDEIKLDQEAEPPVTPWARRRSFKMGFRPRDWADRLAEGMPDPFPNNEQGRRALREKVLGTEPVFVSDLAGGSTASTNRWQFQDGSAIVRKQFGFEEYEDDEFDDDDDFDDSGFDYEGHPGEDYGEHQIAEAEAEVKASLVAEAIGAPALTVIHDPDGHPATVYYGYVEGSMPGGTVADIKKVLETDEAVLIGVLDLLIGNDDRPAFGNWLVTPDGKPFAIDHGESFTYLPEAWVRVPTGNMAIGAFAHHFLRRTLQGSEWVDNRLHPDDIAQIRSRLRALGSALSTGEHRYMRAVLDELAKHAKGERRLVR